MKKQAKLLLLTSIVTIFLTPTLVFANGTLLNANSSSTSSAMNINRYLLSSNNGTTNGNTNGNTTSTEESNSNSNVNNSDVNQANDNNLDSYNSQVDSDVIAMNSENNLLSPNDVLAVVSKMYENQLPKKVSDDLVLDKVYSHDNMISFDYRFLSLDNVTANPKFDFVMNAYLTEQTCSVGDTNEDNVNNFLLLLTQGAHFKYNLYDKNKKLIRSFDQDITKCFTNFD